MMIQRPFSSGSRQAPDPHDNFLEEAGFYRKHTARDSSCLFRAISEQMYDTQTHHLTIRESCVNYMRKNKLYFQRSLKVNSFDVEIDDYLDELSKPKTFGTLLELEAMAHMFARNIILFRPLELGHWFFYKPYFDKNFQVFISHDRHFDTVYTNDFIEDAAFCQSIVYELLYKHVFKLPDITYAVERMLHASSFEEVDSTNDGMYCRQIYLKDGRTFELDTPENTCCILNNYELCHFHNEDFPQMAENLQNEVNKFDNLHFDSKSVTSSEFWSSCGNGSNYNNNGSPYFYPNQIENTISENDYFDCNSRLKQLDSLLPEKYTSCVRQLLYEGITPFPYKVAKALDPDMYRNIEFDSWSEMRKEQRWKNWYTGGNSLQTMSMSCIKVPHNKLFFGKLNYFLQVGVKCQVYLRKQDEYYTGYIQEMPDTQNGPCIVFIEDLGEKRTVPYDCLKPLPPDQVKPWPLPYRWQKQFEKYQQQQNQMYGPAKFFKRFSNHQSKCKMVEFDSYDIMQSYPLDQNFYEKEEINFKLKQYCGLENFTPTSVTTPIEIIALPLSVETDRTPLSSNPQINQTKNAQNTPLNPKNNLNSKTDETPSRPSSRQMQQSIQLPQQVPQPPPPQHHQLIVNPQAQQDITEATYLEEHNMPLEQSSAITVANIGDGSCQYPVYNYYPDPYYAYHQFDNSIIHATSGGQQYYCVLPNSSSNVVQQPGVFPISPNAVAGQINNHITGYGYYPAATASQQYLPSSAVLQPVISQQFSNAANGRHIVSHNNNVNYAVQKSSMESGIDLPNDVQTLRYFFNLGLDYYNELNNGKNKESENQTSKLAMELQKIKIENENSNQANEKADSNNNSLPNNNLISENDHNDHFMANQNPPRHNNDQNYSSRNNHAKYNGSNNRSGDNKHFTPRYFNNRKGNSYNRGNGAVHNNRFMQGSQKGTNMGSAQTQNNRNDNRGTNLNSAAKTLGPHKNVDSNQKINTNEADSSNLIDGNRNKESVDGMIQNSPISTTSDNSEPNQTSTQQNTSISTTSTTAANSYAVPYFAENPSYCNNDQYATVASFNGTSTNGSIFVPQIITPVPFGVCQTAPPHTNTVAPPYTTIAPNGISHGGNYQYISSGQTTPINTSHPPPPLPTAVSNGTPAAGVPMAQTATYSMHTPHLQQQAYYYPMPTQQIPPPGAGTLSANVSETSSSGIGSGGGGNVCPDVNMINYTPEPTGPFPFMNFPVYYTPTNGLTPTANSSTSAHMQPAGSMNGNTYQGYWLASAPVPQQVTMTTPTSNSKVNFGGNSNIAH